MRPAQNRTEPESRDALLTAIAKARGSVTDIGLGRIPARAVNRLHILTPNQRGVKGRYLISVRFVLTPAPIGGQRATPMGWTPPTASVCQGSGVEDHYRGGVRGAA